MSAARSSSSRGPTGAKTWAVRGLLAVVIGSLIGVGTGVFAVRTLEPARANNGVDSLQVMLDSISTGRIAPARGARNPDQTPPVDSPPPSEAVTVPQLLDIEEGAARVALQVAGLDVGEIRFEASTKPAGTVLATTPAPGSSVPRNSPVALVLSDGRSPTDTLPATLPSVR